MMLIRNFLILGYFIAQIKTGTNYTRILGLNSKSGLKYPKVFDKKVKKGKGIQKLDFYTESNEKIKCIVEGLARWLAQPKVLSSRARQKNT